MGNNRYHFTPQIAKKKQVTLLYVSHSVFEKDWGSFPHTHYFMELFYILNGEGYFYIEGKKYLVKPGMILIINPHVLHTEISKEDKPLEYIAIGAEGMSFTFNCEGQNHGIYHTGKSEAGIFYCFHRMVYEMENKQRHFQSICEHLLEVLLYDLTRCSESLLKVSSCQNETPECYKVKKYIDNNYLRDITLEKLAEIAHLNKYYLVHSFTKSYGISPIQYVIQKKMELSKELLLTTNYSILQISQSAGFSSQSYFSQNFKKFCDMSPIDYRKKFRKQYI